MARLHLFEIEDLNKCPRFIRETTTDFLAGLYRVFNIYEPAYAKIVEVLTHTQSNVIIDCCSGSAGPISQLRDYLNANGKKNITIKLTDKYPNTASFTQLEQRYPQQIIGCTQSLDAAALPAELRGMRTFFSSFHHFTPEQAKKILQDAVNQKAPIAIFESTQRHPVDFLKALISPVLLWFIVPFANRMTWTKFIFTYLIPITPITNMWDYIVSNLRTYSSEEFLALIKELDAPNYQWEVGKLWSQKAKCYVPYLTGYIKTN